MLAGDKSHGQRSDTHSWTQNSQMVKYSPDALLYVYEWLLYASSMCSFSQHLIDFARQHCAQSKDIINPEGLHCTAHVSLGPDTRFECNWVIYCITVNPDLLCCLYWTCSLSKTGPPKKTPLVNHDLEQICISLSRDWKCTSEFCGCYTTFCTVQWLN